jgi:signal peptidase I
VLVADSDPVTSSNQPRSGAGDVAGTPGGAGRGPSGRPPAHAAAPVEPQGSRGLSLLRETAIIIVSALVLSWLIKTFLVQAFFIPSESMMDTLEVGDRVMVSRMVPDVFDVNRGDVVVFKDPGGWLPPYQEEDRGPVGNALRDAATFVGLLPQDTGEHLIKRVIGMPGDTVECCDAEGRIMINGTPIDESEYLAAGAIPSELEFSTTVPDDMLFVLGDNRQHSKDSRYNTGNPGGGFVPMENVVGNAFVIVWPFDDARVLRNPGDVFAKVPAP